MCLMQPADFSFDLPPDLIAQKPLAERVDSRLLRVRGTDGGVEDMGFTDFAQLLNSGDLLVLNDTRVLPARLHGHKASGGKLELLLERILGPHLARVQLRSSRAPQVGVTLQFDGGESAVVQGREGNFFVLEFSSPIETVLQQHGHMPLPPYIERADDPADRERYQTVFAKIPGAVAAPTAGLHFDRRQLNRLRAKGVDVATLTLHVGAGTFAPLRQEQIETGRLHAERVEVSASVCRAIAATRQRGGRVIAVGTTTVRALESAARELGDAQAQLQPWSGETTLFIRPGDRFYIVDAMLTNFHLPESSLLMLVCAFAGTRTILAAYEHAIRERYRFFSYGDAMFCERANSATAAG
jgi:S-adenosylmethionine:tRNA ribosyltransferase-isomerase